MSGTIYGLVIPKYGMVMTEGALAAWHVEEGARIKPGDEIIDIETEKVVNAYESQVSGVLRRRVAQQGENLPVGALFAVVAEESATEAEIDAFIEEFNANFSPATAAAVGPQPEVLDAGGRRIRYLRVGEDGGFPMLLVHGFGGDLNNWMFNQEALATDRAVYALDLPGHGGSLKAVESGDVAALADTVAAFLGELKTGKVHVTGHSLGGAIALELAHRRPELVASLTLLAPAGLGSEINSAFITSMVEADRRKEMQAVLQDLFHDPSLVSRDMVMNILKAKRIDGAVQCLRVIAERCFAGGAQQWQARETLQALTVPVQVIWGTGDRIIPPSHAAGLPATVPVHLLDDAGHMVHMERAGDVNRLILQLVEGN
jgi:pyruvate dehydrogenase E2 component (dihydrolipoamide acetyltransferase)